MEQLVSMPLPSTPEEFLAWEQLQDERYEFDGEGPVLVNGGTVSHARIERNIVGELWLRLRGSPFEVFGSTIKVQVGRSCRYPDASVTDVPLRGAAVTVEAFLILFEVISPVTEATDRQVKLLESRSLPILHRYVLAEQDECELIVHTRFEEGWTQETLLAGRTLVMPETGVAVPVDAFYTGVFPSA